MLKMPHSKSIACLLVALICLLISAGPLRAEGDGSGGGQDVPLGLVSSTPANGAQNVALDVKIKLVFNKNVVNMTVKENNQRCFSLSAGTVAVPVDVQMADDQIYPELKRDVTLVPRQALKPGTSYTVVISRALQAKNGAVLGQDTKIRFTTVAAPGVNPPAASGGEEKVLPPSRPDGTSRTESGTDDAKKETVSNSEKAKISSDEVKPDVKLAAPSKTRVEPGANGPSSTSSSPVQTSKQTAKRWPIFIATIILLGAGYWYLRRKR